MEQNFILSYTFSTVPAATVPFSIPLVVGGKGLNLISIPLEDNPLARVRQESPFCGQPHSFWLRTRRQRILFYTIRSERKFSWVETGAYQNRWRKLRTRARLAA